MEPGQTVILDNATFHKFDSIITLAKAVGAEILYLPPYSPDFNKIEHHWFAIKKQSQEKHSSFQIFSSCCRFLHPMTYSDYYEKCYNYQAAVFEVTSSGKGRKMATLIDEFGYFEENGQFKLYDYHERKEYDGYNSSEVSIEKDYTVTVANSEFYLTGHNLILHTTPQELF